MASKLTMPSVLSVEFVPSGQILPTENASKEDVMGIISDFKVLRGGFIAAHALYGRTDSVHKLARSRQGINRIFTYPTGLEYTPARLQCSTDQESNLPKVQLEFNPRLREPEAEQVIAIAKLSELAAKMAFASQWLQDSEVPISSRFTVEDGHSLSQFEFEANIIPITDISMPRLMY